MRREDGQATVELVALLPLLLVIAFAAAALLASHIAGEQAGQAAEAGAVALLQGGDPREAARRALSAGARRRADIAVHDRPNLPLAALERPRAGEAVADAGPEPAP